MTKAQAAALLLAGATAGVGGKTLVGALAPGEAEAKSIAPYSHAVDLRRAAPDAGVAVLVYGTRPGVDGGASADVGQAKSCKFTAATLKKAEDTMNALAAECNWEKP